MLIGQIEADRPVISIPIGSGLGTVQNVLVLVDTGFTAELKISPKLAEQLGIKNEYVEKVSLAAGEPIYLPAGFAYVSLEGKTQKVSVIIGGSPSIGVGFLRKFEYVLKMDFTADDFSLQKKHEDPFNREE